MKGLSSNYRDAFPSFSAPLFPMTVNEAPPDVLCFAASASDGSFAEPRKPERTIDLPSKATCEISKMIHLTNMNAQAFEKIDRE